MAEQRKKVLHIRSNVGNRVPTSNQIEYGEIAVNFAKNREFLSFKNSNNEIATIKSDGYFIEYTIGISRFDETQTYDNGDVVLYGEDIHQDIYEFTTSHQGEWNDNHVQRITLKEYIDEKVASGGSFNPDEYYTKLEIDDRDLVVSASLNDLNENKVDRDDMNTSLSDYTYDKATIDRKIASGGTFDPTLYYTTGQTYNRTEIDNKIASGGSFNPELYYTQVEIDEFLGSDITSLWSVTDAVDKVQDEVDDIKEQLEEIAASGGTHTHLNKAILDTISGEVYTKTEVYNKTEIDTLERVIASSLNDLEETKVDRDEMDSSLSDYTYDKATIDRKVGSGGTFDPSQYYTTGQTYNKAEIDRKVASGGTFDPELYYTQAEIDVFLGSDITLLWSVTDAVDKVQDEVDDINEQLEEIAASGGIHTHSNKAILDTISGEVYTKAEIDSLERVIASSLNDLEETKVGRDEMDSEISDYTYDKATIDRKVASAGSFDPTQYYTKAEVYNKDEIISNEKVISKALNDLNKYRTFNVGSNTVSTLANIPITRRFVLATGITSSNSALSLGGILTEGYEMYIIVNGTPGTEITLDSNMINTNTQGLFINIKGYCEISIISASNGSTYYVHGT